ncbi:unnamed protein product [Pedinophyceae sp. YPF-701]|nr:unnamed protein product [Pedinophyceae sp. YPF-701]
MGSKKKHQKGKARSGSASKAGASSHGCGAAKPRAGAAEQTIRQNTTCNELMAAIEGPAPVVDMGGRTIELIKERLTICGRNKTIANCTIKCRASHVYCEPRGGDAAENICFRNVTFEGDGTGIPANMPQPSKEVVSEDGMVVVAGARGVSFEHCTFRHAKAPVDPRGRALAAGLNVFETTVRIDDCRFLNNMGPGLAATGSTTVLVVNDSEIRGNLLSGINATNGACIDVAGSQLSDNGLDGILAADSDVRATETVCSGNRHCGAAVAVTGGGAGGKLVLDRCRMDGNAVAAIMACREGARVAATDVECVMGENRHRCRGELIAGVQCVDGARCTIRGGRIAGFHVGLSARDASSIVASNVDCSGGQFGIMAGAGATVRLERATLRRNVCCGIAADSGATVSAGDCEMHLNGEGVGAHGRGQVRLERCSVSGGCFAGVVADGAGTRIDLEDVEITRYVKSGIEVRDGAQVAMRGGSMTRNKGPGCSAEGRGTVVTLAGVECARNGGANVEVRGGASLTVDGAAIRPESGGG